jgi:hypothetical protein
LLIGTVLAVAALVPTARAAAQTFESADLSLQRFVGIRFVGNTTYNGRTLRVTNNGPGDARGPLTVVANLFPGEQLSSGPPRGWACSMSAASQVTCTFPAGLRALDQTEFQFWTTAPKDSGNICDWHDATVSSPSFDPNPSNNQAPDPRASTPRVCGASNADAPPGGTYTAPSKGPPTTSTTRPTTVGSAPSATVESGSHPATETRHTTTPASVLGATFARPVVQATQTTPVVANTGMDVFDELAVAELVLVAGVGLLLLSRARVRFAFAQSRRN